MKEANPFKSNPFMPARRYTRSVGLHIERLVLDGVNLNGAQAAQVQSSMQHELTRLLEQNGLPSAGEAGATPVLTAPQIHNVDSSDSADLGRRVARSVYESLTRGL
jgi:hypothetical protein